MHATIANNFSYLNIVWMNFENGIIRPKGLNPFMTL